MKNCKEGQRNGNDQSAGATGNEEGQRTIDPGLPACIQPHGKHPHQRRQYSQRQRGIAHRRRYKRIGGPIAVPRTASGK